MVAIYPQITEAAYARTPSRIGAANDSLSIMSSQGITGLRQWYGRVYEELLPELQTERGRLTYRQMMENDGTIGAVLNGIEMILRGVHITAQPTGTTKEHERQAEFIDQCKDDMETAFIDFACENIRGAIGYGWSFSEIQYKRRLGPEPKQPEPTEDDPYPYVPPSQYDDGTIGWWKFGMRGQDALWRWEFSPDMRLIGMWQLPPPDYRLRFIDYERSLLFRPSQHKENPEGRSLLRNAYRAWYMKSHFETIEGIGVERDLAGLPIFWGPPELLSTNLTPDQQAVKQAAMDIVRNIRRDEQEGIFMPLLYDAAGHKLYDLTLLSSSGTRQFNTDVVISRYDQRIAMTLLADFLLLGHESSGAGSYAQVKSRTSLWIMAFNALLTMFCDVLNSRAVPKLIRANGWDVTFAPKIVYADVKSLSVQEMGQLMQMLAQAGFPVGQDRALYNYILGEAAAPSDGSTVVYKNAEESAIATVQIGGGNANAQSSESIKDSRNATKQGTRSSAFSQQFEEGEGQVGDSAMNAPEYERKFAVDPSKLPELQSPWCLVQGYWINPSVGDHGTETSLRVIPARDRAYLRVKDMSLDGKRNKMSERVDLGDAMQQLKTAQGVVYKERHLMLDPAGRAWLIDHFPEQDHWQAETEFETEKLMNELPVTPPWITHELTNDQAGYTRTYAQPRSEIEIASLLKHAAAHGSQEPYEPAEAEEVGKPFKFHPQVA